MHYLPIKKSFKITFRENRNKHEKLWIVLAIILLEPGSDYLMNSDTLSAIRAFYNMREPWIIYHMIFFSVLG
jgi:hypothetical protein